MTGIELARRTGVSPSYISLIEHGEKLPSEEVAVRIARALGEREETYRVWVATARMDEKTRHAVMRMRGGESITRPVPRPPAEPPPDVDAIRRPPGRPRVRESDDFQVALHLEEEGRSPVLRIPLLVPGSLPLHDPPAPDEIEALLAVDARALDRRSPRGLVALRVDDLNGREAVSWLRPRDLVVLDRRPQLFDPALLHAFRLDETLVLAHGSIGPGVLLVLPDPSHAGAPRVVPLPRPEELAAVHFGSVIWSSRRWAG